MGFYNSLGYGWQVQVYTKDELRNIDNIKVFKVGRTTGISAGKLIPGSSSVAIEMRDGSIKFSTEVVDEESKIRIPKPPSFTIEHCDHWIYEISTY